MMAKMNQCPGCVWKPGQQTGHMSGSGVQCPGAEECPMSCLMQDDEPLQEGYCEDDLASGPDEDAVKQRQPYACSGQDGG